MSGGLTLWYFYSYLPLDESGPCSSIPGLDGLLDSMNYAGEGVEEEPKNRGRVGLMAPDPGIYTCFPPNSSLKRRLKDGARLGWYVSGWFVVF